MRISEDAWRNRAHRGRTSDAYQAQHGAFVGQPEPRWGTWQLPEDELRMLGEVADKDAPWSSRSTYREESELTCARHWASEAIWKARKW